MSNNREKTKEDDADRERVDSDEPSSDDESETREIVLGLPCLSLSSRISGDISVVDREEEAVARLNEEAVAAAELVVAAAEEAVLKGKSDAGSRGMKKIRPRKLTKTDEEADGLGQGETKKPKKKAAEWTYPERGPPVCEVCGRGFASWKAVFGHMRAHRERNFYVFLPPPTHSAAAEVLTIPGQNSTFVLRTAGGGSSGGLSASGGGGAPGGEGGRGVGIDLNVEPVEEVEEATESRSIAKFDLNRSPPKDEEEDEAKR